LKSVSKYTKNSWKYQNKNEKTKIKHLWLRLWDPSEIHRPLHGYPGPEPMYPSNRPCWLWQVFKVGTFLVLIHLANCAISTSILKKRSLEFNAKKKREGLPPPPNQLFKVERAIAPSQLIPSWDGISGACTVNSYRAHEFTSQALVSFKKYMPPPLPYFKVNICPFPLPHFASIFFAYLWSSRWPNYIVTLPRYFSFRLPHLNIPTGPPSEELDKNIQRTSLRLLFSHWNGYSHFRSGLNWFRKKKKVL
jgi:hypothetical protein